VGGAPNVQDTNGWQVRAQMNDQSIRLPAATTTIVFLPQVSFPFAADKVERPLTVSILPWPRGRNFIGPHAVLTATIEGSGHRDHW
jgi:hypothetical protein